MSDIDNEKLEQQKNNATWNETLTQEQLFETISEWIQEFYEQNKERFTSLTAQDVFLSYIQENKENEFINKLQNLLWRELSFDDIKYLYLKSNYTLEQSITKDIFKKFKRKNVVKSIITKFDEKYNDLLSSLWYSFDIKQFLPEIINSSEDIDNIFENIKDYLHNFYKNLSKEEKEKLKNIKITNEEILNQLIIDWILTEEESKILKKEIWDISSFSNNQLEEVYNIQSVLLNSNIVNSFETINSWFEQMNLDLEKTFKFPKLFSLLEEYRKVSSSNLEKIWEKIKDNLTEKEKEELTNCNGDKNCIRMYKKFLIEEYLWDINNLISYIKEEEKNKNQIWLSSILKKLINNQWLTESETKLLFSFMKKEFIENNVEKIARLYSLTEEQKNDYKTIFEQLFDENKNTLNIYGNIVNIEKNIVFPTINDVDDLENIMPNIIFTIFWDKVEQLSNVSWLKKYFVEIDSKKITTFTKVNITWKDGVSTSWYIQETENGEIEIYSSPYILNNEVNPEPIKTIKKEDIDNIEKLEEDRLILNANTDLKDLCLWFVSVIAPEKVYEYNTENIKNLLKETEQNKSTEQNEKPEEALKEFKKEFSYLEWDSNTEFKKWAILWFKWINLWYPSISHNYYYYQIIDIDEENLTFTLKVWWGIVPFSQDVEKEIVLPIDAKLLKKIKYNNNGNLFKYEKYDSLEKFWENIKNINLKSDYQWMEKWLSLWQNNIEVKNGKFVNREKNEEIKYIWKEENGKFDVYKIETLDNKVVLTHPYDTSFKKELDYNTFLMMISSNQLSPWSETEFKTIEKDVNFKPSSKDWFWKLFTVNDIILSSKQVMDNIKYYFKEDDELRAAEMFEKMASKLPNWWILWDVKMEAKWEKDSKIWKRIENAKSRLERAWEGKGKNHGKDAANIIEKEIFSKIKSGKPLWYRQQLKAAWYLLYAMDKWPWPYFRALAKYEGKWMWVKALLWDEHYEKYRLKVKKLEQALRKDPKNENLRYELVTAEMFYIKDEDDASRKYSNNFWATLEWNTINLYSNSKVQSVKEWEETKWNYTLVYGALKSYITNNRAPNVIWALKSMSERVWDYNEYVDYYKAISMIIMSWYAYNDFWTPLKESFDKICKTYWVPVWLFWSDYYGLNKMLKVYDYIVKKKGIKPWWKDTFTEYLYWVKNPDNVDVLSLKTQDQRKNIIKKMESFWKENWEEIVVSLDYTDDVLLKYENDKKVEATEKEVLWEYFDKVNDNITENFAFDSDLFKTSYAPYYQNGIFNIPAWTFSKIALNIDDWDFDSSIKWVAQWMWVWVISKLSKFETEIEENSEMYKFVLRKYINWMWRFYKWEEKENFKKALISKDKNLLKKSIIDLNRNTRGSDGQLPIEMVEWLEKFVEVFMKWTKDLENVVNDIL